MVGRASSPNAREQRHEEPLPARSPGRQRRPAGLRRQHRLGRRQGHASELGAAGRRRCRARLDPGQHDRRSAHRRRPTGSPTSATSPPSRASSIWCSRAMPCLASPRQRRILHAGPPIAWADMCGPQQGAICGAILYEGWAKTLEAAEAMAAIRRRRARALPRTTARSGRWPASSARRCRSGWSRTPTAGNRAFCNLNEGLGKVLRFGANSPDVLERLRWLGSEFFATMRKSPCAVSPTPT